MNAVTMRTCRISWNSRTSKALLGTGWSLQRAGPSMRNRVHEEASMSSESFGGETGTVIKRITTRAELCEAVENETWTAANRLGTYHRNPTVDPRLSDLLHVAHLVAIGKYPLPYLDKH